MNKEILKRYFEGRSSNWEKKQVQEYFEGDDLRIFDEYVREQEENTNDAQNADPDQKHIFYDKLTARINEIEDPGKVKKMRAYKPFLKIAASIILFISIGGALYLKIKQQAETVSRALTSVINNTSVLKRVELKDGSKVWLTPGTKLTYNEINFNDTDRRVSVTGEAYFNVAHNKAKPFHVKAGSITTTVLGTTFNVEAYANETDVRVTLVTGLVRVISANKTSLIYPGQLLKYSGLNETMKITAVDVTDKQALFTSGKLVFEDLPLTDVLKRMERVFNMQISIPDTAMLADKYISAAYYRDAPETILRRVLFIHGLHFNKKGENKYVILK